MKTPWGETLNPDAVWQEYPRPQLERDSYLNLNGWWQYAITESDEPPESWDGRILVPFSPESELSGVARALRPGQTLWYRRDFELPPDFVRYHTFLHFGAVDQEATVWLNGAEVGSHQGGYNAFCFRVRETLREGENTLLVRVHDDTDAGSRTRGKQSSKPGGIWYTAQSGIWQTVWMESVPRAYVRDLRIVPRLDKRGVELTIFSDEGEIGEATIGETAYPVRANQPTLLPLERYELWSPEHPALLSLEIRLGDDRVRSYFAMRSVTVEPDAQGVPRLFLNGEPYFQLGLLDQGYWPDGLYTPPSDEAIQYDLQAVKRMGFNMLRKHIKVEPMRWYYHCDRLGLLVWQDMPSGGGTYRKDAITLPLITGLHRNDHDYRRFAREDAQGREAYRAELREMIAQLRNVPCIGMWVPFNEGWGQFDAKDACRIIRELDDTRPIDHASGWHDQGVSSVKSLHVYFKPYRFRKDRRGRAVVLSEYGGYNLRVPEHAWSDADYGYNRQKDAETLWQSYRRLMEREILPAIPRGLSAAVYTQLTDVEEELNGLLTYDRRVQKMSDDRLRPLHERCIEAGRTKK